MDRVRTWRSRRRDPADSAPARFGGMNLFVALLLGLCAVGWGLMWLGGP